MKIQLVCVAAVAAALCACTPSEPPMPNQVIPAPAPLADQAAPPATLAATTSPLAGKWAGTITCYKIESPLTATIDAAKPTEATLTKGEGGSLSWPATVAIDETARTVTLTSTGPVEGAELSAGKLSEDGASITGTMDKQLCTGFSLKKQS